MKIYPEKIWIDVDSRDKPFILHNEATMGMCAYTRSDLAPVIQPSGDVDVNICPKCGGDADNGFDRCLPPNPYYCSKCETAAQHKPVEVDEGLEEAGDWIRLLLPLAKGYVHANPGIRSTECIIEDAESCLSRIIPPTEEKS